jgi:hypothetical protein
LMREGPCHSPRRCANSLVPSIWRKRRGVRDGRRAGVGTSRPHERSAANNTAFSTAWV